MTSPLSPPYPANIRARGWRFELDYEAIDSSDTWTLAGAAGPEGRPLLLMLWLTAWRQTPAGSLPDDHSLIAAQLGIPAKMFLKYKDVLMRRWWLASDGRLYHPVMTQRVEEMMKRRQRINAAIADLRERSYRIHRQLLIERDGYACRYCGRSEVSLQIDHVTPRSRGGTDDPENLVLACKPCNASKGARTPEEWRQ